jgi:uncharacterized protein YjbJ (UPF0337 family)
MEKLIVLIRTVYQAGKLVIRRKKMNEDILKGKWNQLKGDVKMRWGDLTDDEVDMIEGRRDKLVGKLQERYGYTKDRAEREVESFINESGHH